MSPGDIFFLPALRNFSKCRYRTVVGARLCHPRHGGPRFSEELPQHQLRVELLDCRFRARDAFCEAPGDRQLDPRERPDAPRATPRSDFCTSPTGRKFYKSDGEICSRQLLICCSPGSETPRKHVLGRHFFSPGTSKFLQVRRRKWFSPSFDILFSGPRNAQKTCSRETLFFSRPSFLRYRSGARVGLGNRQGLRSQDHLVPYNGRKPVDGHGSTGRRRFSPPTAPRFRQPPLTSRTLPSPKFLQVRRRKLFSPTFDMLFSGL